MTKKLYGRPTYSIVRATISLLKVWYSNEESDDIISLGVCSNGTTSFITVRFVSYYKRITNFVGAFAIPNGIVFSQPVMLNDKKIWQPFRKFPLTKKAEEEIQKLVLLTQETLDNFGIGKVRTTFNI